jgi:hypothetical protein
VERDAGAARAGAAGLKAIARPSATGSRHHRARHEGLRVDRLARSIGDLQDIVRAVKAKGASLKATEQPIDTSTAAGKAFLDTLGVFAEFETNLRKERQLEGIAKAKAAGGVHGPPGFDRSDRGSEAQGRRARRLGNRALARHRPRLGLSRARRNGAVAPPIGRGASADRAAAAARP